MLDGGTRTLEGEAQPPASQESSPFDSDEDEVLGYVERELASLNQAAGAAEGSAEDLDDLINQEMQGESGQDEKVCIFPSHFLSLRVIMSLLPLRDYSLYFLCICLTLSF